MSGLKEQISTTLMDHQNSQISCNIVQRVRSAINFKISVPEYEDMKNNFSDQNNKNSEPNWKKPIKKSDEKRNKNELASAETKKRIVSQRRFTGTAASLPTDGTSITMNVWQKKREMRSFQQ
ncbi:unnamed protein product [Brugia pahangi]|uniref:Uncharacterized protein n=1 Tax=Brugia pahangi TaxID=6280 RepID=A0A0N4TN33_BRUPA|nr:unnamed protein product [Brugia pahangi]